LGRVFFSGAATALVLAVQSPVGCVLSVFFASVNGWHDGCFQQVFSSDDGQLDFFADNVLCEQLR